MHTVQRPFSRPALDSVKRTVQIRRLQRIVTVALLIVVLLAYAPLNVAFQNTKYGYGEGITVTALESGENTTLSNSRDFVSDEIFSETPTLSQFAGVDYYESLFSEDEPLREALPTALSPDEVFTDTGLEDEHFDVTEPVLEDEIFDFTEPEEDLIDDTEPEPEDELLSDAEPEDEQLNETEPEDEQLGETEPGDEQLSEAEPEDEQLDETEPEDEQLSDAELEAILEYAGLLSEPDDDQSDSDFPEDSDYAQSDFEFSVGNELTLSLTESSGKYIWPAYGKLTSPFGPRVTTVGSTNHRGIDIAAKMNSPIYAADAGTVIVAGWSNSYGNYVVIRHSNGHRTLYGHCNSLLVSVGETVAQGQQIAHMGTTGVSTGVHLHFELIIDGTKVDPLPYLPE